MFMLLLEINFILSYLYLILSLSYLIYTIHTLLADVTFAKKH